MSLKKRLDQLLVERELAPTRSKAQALIMAGDVTVDGKRVDKSGTNIPVDAEIVVKVPSRFVSRGGEKLAGALADFSFSADGKICADVGASTGGFTDCLLQNGAAKVYAIDVGYGQLAHKIRIDPRVVVLERTNARHLQSLPEPVELVVIDASFISLRLLLPVLKFWMKVPGDVIALIKPQFEVGKHDVGKGGVVRDIELHRRVLLDIASFSIEEGFTLQALTVSPLKGLKEGNTEFLVWLQWGKIAADVPNLPALVDTLLTRIQL